MIIITIEEIFYVLILHANHGGDKNRFIRIHNILIR